MSNLGFESSCAELRAEVDSGNPENKLTSLLQ